MSDLNIQAVVEMSSGNTDQVIDRIGSKAGQMAVNMAEAGKKAGQAVDQIGEIAKGTGEKFTRAESAIVTSIKRLATEAAKAKDITQQLGNIEFNVAAKGLDASKFRPMLDVVRQLQTEYQGLETAAKSVQAANRSLDSMGLSAKQTAAALRGVPAQFTDIVVSLQAGQNPLTVFLQQGGQLKDMFGGAGIAARALGGYIVGLINPFTVAAAAAAGLAVAYNQGANEAQAFAKAITLSGNAAKTTTTDLQRIAAGVSLATGATQGAVAEALTQAVQSGKVAESALASVAAAAVAMSSVSGRSVSDLVKEFASLGDEPVKATVKLNEQYRFLTEAVYLQIKALDDEGRASDAARLAQESYADVMKARADEIKGNLGAIESAWGQLGNAAKAAWDQMLGIGRKEMPEDKLSSLQDQLQFAFNMGAQEGDATVRWLEREIAAMQAIVDKRGEAARYAAEQAAAEQAGIKWLQEGEKYLSKSVMMKREIAQAEQLGIAAGRSREEIEKRIAAIRERFADKGKSDDQKDAESIARQIKALEDQAATYGLAEKSITLYKLAQDGATASQLKHAELVLDEISALKERDKFAKDYAKAVGETVGKLEDRALVLETELQNYGLTKSQIERTTVARLEEVRAMARANGATEDYLANLDREIAARKRIAEATAGVEAAEANSKAADDAAQDWQRTAASIEDAIYDAIVSGGEDAGKVLERTFEALVLRPFIQPIAQAGAGVVTSAMGLGAQGQGGSSGGIGLPPGIGSTSMLSTGLQWAGSALGSATLSSFGAGMSMTTAQIANLSSAGLINGTAASLGSTVATAMPYIGAALFAAQALGLFDKKPSDKSAWASYDPTTGRTFDVGSMTGKKDPGQEQRDATAALAMLTGGFAGLAGIDASVTAMVGGRDGTRLRINRDEGTQGFLTPQAGLANGGNSLNYGNGEEAIKKMLDDLVDEGTLPTEVIEQWRTLKTDAQGVARDAVELVSTLNLLTEGYDAATIERANLLQQEGEALESSLARMTAIEQALSGTALPGDAMAQSAAAMVKEFERLNQAVPLSAEALGQVISGLDLTTAEGRAAYQSLMALAPAFLELQAAQDQLYNSLLTDQQRLMLASGELAGAFEQLGVAAPKSREEFMALVDGIDVTTEAGAKLKAQMLGLAPTFLEVEAGIQQMLSDVGINLSEFQTSIRDAILGRTDAAEAGNALATMVVDGVYNGIAGSYAQQITDLVATGIITPIVQAAVTGASITDAVSQGAIDSIVASANAAAVALNAVLSDPAFKSAMEQIGGTISNITVGAASNVTARPYSPTTRTQPQQSAPSYTAQQDADPLFDLLNERRQLEIELLRAQGREMEADNLARADAIKGFSAAAIAAYDFNRALEDQIEAIQRAAQVAAERDGLERQLLQVQGDTAGLRARDLAALDESNRALQQHIWALQDQADAAAKAAQIERDRMSAADNALRQAENNLRAAYNREAGELRQTITQLEGFTRSLRDLKRELMGGSLSPLDIFGRRDELSRQFADVAARAAAGDEQAMGELSGLTSQYLGVVQESASSAEDYYRKFAAVSRTLDDTQSVAERELDATRYQLELLDRQVSALITINDSVLSVRDAINAFLAAQTAQKTTASVAGYVSSQVSAASSYAASGVVLDSSAAKPQTAQEQQIASLYSSLLGREADAGGLKYWTSSSMSYDQIAQSIASSAEAAARAISKEAQNQFLEDVNKSLGLTNSIKAFASGGYHTGGLRLVGEQGPELEVTGPARIYSADQTRAMLGGSNEDMVRELRALRAELAELKAASAATARSTSDTARILTRTTNGGNAMLVETAA